MSAFNDYIEQLIRDMFKNGSPVPTQDTYLGIATQDPGDTGGLTGEPTGGWYSRQLIETTGGASPQWTNATGQTGIENAQAITFPGATTTPGTAKWVFLIDSTTGGANNMLMRAKLDSARTLRPGDQPQFGAGEVKFTFQIPASGDYFLIADAFDDEIQRWDASKSFDIDTLSNVSITGFGFKTFRGLDAANDGAKLYASEDGDDLQEFDLSTPWDPASASLVNQNTSINFQGGTYTVQENGQNIILIEYKGSDYYISSYSLGTKYDITTLSSTGSTALSNTGASFPDSGAASSDGEYFFGVNSSEVIQRINLSSPWDAGSVTQDQSKDVSGNVTAKTEGAHVSHGGNYFFVTDGNGVLYQFSFGTPYDLSTLSFDKSNDIAGISASGGLTIGPYPSI